MVFAWRPNAGYPQVRWEDRGCATWVRGPDSLLAAFVAPVVRVFWQILTAVKFRAIPSVIVKIGSGHVTSGICVRRKRVWPSQEKK